MAEDKAMTEDKPSESGLRQGVKASLSRMRQFFGGFVYPFRGLKMIFTHFRLFKYAVAPMLINTVLFIALLFIGKHYWIQFITRLAPDDSAPVYLIIVMWVAYYLAIIFGFIVYCLICFLLFAAIGSIVAAPFLDLLSERTEWVFWEEDTETPFSIKLLLRDLGILLLEEVRKLATWVIFMICILPLLLIPVAGQILFVFFSTTFSIYFLGLAFVDFSLARRRHSFTTKRAFAWRVKYHIFGLGTAIYVTLLLPIIGFLCLPISAVGGTLLFCEHANDEERKFLRPDKEEPKLLPPGEEKAEEAEKKEEKTEEADASSNEQT